MSSSLSSVPSKAALTALRGLVVGTSCAIAFIAEDRRRKINCAKQIIENGERIKSAKRYRPGGTALALAIEEEALWDPALVSPSRARLVLHQVDAVPTPIPSGRKIKQSEELDSWDDIGPMADMAGVVVSDQGDTSNTNSTGVYPQPEQPGRTDPYASLQNLPNLRTTAPKPGPSWLWSNTEVVRLYAFPTVDEIVTKVHEACRSREPRQIGSAVRTVHEAMNLESAPSNLDSSWIEATALLCRVCQEEGRLKDAVDILCRVVTRGTLEEGAYHSHKPFTLIESLLAHTELSEQTRDVYLKNLSTAIKLFLPTFQTPPTDPDNQMYSLGRRLLEICFSLRRMSRIFGLYRRCNMVAGENSDDLTSWFLTRLYEQKDYRSVVKVFCSTYPKSSPTEASVHAIGDIIVESVELALNYKADQVLKTLHGVCSRLGNTKLKSQWVIKLLVCHWKQHHSFQAVEALFETLRTPSLKDTVFRSDSVYRIMVELALEAGEEDKAESYFMAGVAQNPALASDVRLLGVLARFHAKDGDWEAVRADFEAMRRRGGPHTSRVFVPILKAYAETHTVRETEAFLKSYVDELKVPLCSHMVTLMAKQYAAIRDVDSLVEWLDYCSRADFPVDAAFTNAILVSCRRQWRFPFRDLRTLFRKLRALNPKFVDGHTEQVMKDAALADSKYGGKAAKGRLLSLRLDPNKVSSQGKRDQVEDVILAMKKALTCDRPQRAASIYKRAVHLGMPFSPRALRLAVQARLISVPNDYQGAYSLIRDAQSRGEDVNGVINYLVAKQLGEITTTADKSDVYNTIQATLARFQKGGFQITENFLHRAALVCLTAGHFRGAINYALKAAEVRGASCGPCFNLQNFKILLATYAELIDINGIRDTIDRCLTSQYKEDAACRRALKHARARVMHSQARSVTHEQRMRARAVVDEGIKTIVEARKALRAEGKKLEAEAIRIMKQAALDAGCPPVEFGNIPWLGGGKGGKVADGELEAVVDEFPSEDYFSVLERELDAPGRVTAVEAF
ncbi:hypothetical protein C8A03DRAFT_35153 [Achaetomium macrosporum]|uniref:Pentatricopeptide repeat protein n=1 Tax=Achaetomium macrosporum TaxID=79813 RepID=A0AAN7C8W0_9PEZI|nr:hypothetical protein C8A03DRAFT_35153 [Achaetomium macrosporum]